MTKILFVCHGNICRSPMAEFVFRDMAARAGLTGCFSAASAATSAEELGNPVYPPVRKLLAAHGIDCSGKLARRICPQDYKDFDLLLGMDGENMANMSRCFGGDPAGKLHTLLEYAGRPGASVADPWYTRDFQAAWEDVFVGCLGLLSSLHPSVTLDFSGCTDRPSLYRELRRKMLWQEWYGETLDALHDILTGLPHFGKRFTVILPPEDTLNACRDYAQRICAEFEAAGKEIEIL